MFFDLQSQLLQDLFYFSELWKTHWTCLFLQQAAICHVFHHFLQSCACTTVLWAVGCLSAVTTPRTKGIHTSLWASGFQKQNSSLLLVLVKCKALGWLQRKCAASGTHNMALLGNTQQHFALVKSWLSAGSGKTKCHSWTTDRNTVLCYHSHRNQSGWCGVELVLCRKITTRAPLLSYHYSLGKDAQRAVLQYFLTTESVTS